MGFYPDLEIQLPKKVEPDQPDDPDPPVEPDPELPSRDFRPDGTGDFGFYQATRTIELPRNGEDGLSVRRLYPDATINLDIRKAISPDLEQRIRILADKAYLQWRRHNPDREGTFDIQVGETEDLNCGALAIACWSPDDDVVVLTSDLIRRINLTLPYDEGSHEIIRHLFLVLSHEAGHQFGYSNPDGISRPVP